MPILTSIESLERVNIKETQNRPIIVHANDLNFYCCKYHGGIGAANRLFREYIVASFLQYWEIEHPPFQLISVLPEHVPPDLTIPKNRFEAPCFGSRILKDAEDLNQISENILIKVRRKQQLKETLLRLAFFDIWTCNEDRHTGNYNLLLQLKEDGYTLVPIDHEACFNHQTFERGLVSITYHDSLIYTTLFEKLFKPEDFKRPKYGLDILKPSFYLCSSNCGKNIDEILQKIPLEWNIDIVEKRAQLTQFLLHDDWFNECWDTFLEFLQYFSN